MCLPGTALRKVCISICLSMELDSYTMYKKKTKQTVTTGLVMWLTAVVIALEWLRPDRKREKEG